MERVSGEEVRAFLAEADLTLSGLEAPEVRLWAVRDDQGAIVGTTGYEMSDDGAHVLLRSVAVGAGGRRRGLGTELARAALEEAAKEGAGTAWLFSRRSGPFWERMGFGPADREELARNLATTHQVRLFTRTGQLGREVAWRRAL